MAQSAPASNVEATTVRGVHPAAVAYDTSGNLYIALRNDHLVRKVDLNGIITTVAGTGTEGFSGDGAAATSAQLDSPTGVAVDANGNLYIADSRNHRVREVSSGIITTIAGTGTAGYSGEGGAATTAQLDLPTALSFDTSGNLYIADTDNHCIRRIIAGTISTVAGRCGQQGTGGVGATVTTLLLDTPTGVAADPNTPGQFYISDTHNQQVLLIGVQGSVSAVAGNGSGVPGFSGDGAAATASTVANPRGLSVAGNGSLYFADSDNQRIRVITGGVISTFAGTGLQGFGGDIASPTSAFLDSPSAIALNSTGTLAFADTHNQRVRSIASGAINTVSGIAPANTEGLLLAGPTSGVYGGTIGTLTATFSNGSNTTAGTLTLTDSGVAIATAPLSGNVASFNLNALSGGLHTLAVSFKGDETNPAAASGVYLVNIAPAAQTVTFPALASPVTYTPGLTEALAATSTSGLPITYTVTGPATVSGATLTITGPGNVVVTASQLGSMNYMPSIAVSQTVVVVAPLSLVAISPSSVSVGTTNLSLVATGTGFTSASVVRFNGTVLATTFNSSTQITAVIPSLSTLGMFSVTVFDSSTQQLSNAQTLTVVVPAASATLNVPPQSASGQQPSINVTLQTAYPVPITGIFTLSFTPSGSGVDDPAIQFSNGLRTFPFTIPAGSTAIPMATLQTGTVAGTITVNLTLTAQGVDVTPATARVATITVAPQPPTISAVTLTQSGATLTVTVTGFSNVRAVTQANFTFTPAPGTDLSTTQLSLPATNLFSSWYTQASSNAYGSTFLYTQTFTLSDANSKVQSVTVTLTNSAGNSFAASSP